MNTQIKLILSAAVVAGTLGSSAAFAGLSGNVGVGSNYIWRGVTQTEDQAAISGGLDYDFGNGLSVGTWASNVDFGGDTGYELDVYGGYGGKAGALDYSVGFTHYAYPVQDNFDFTEVNGSLGFGPATLGVAVVVNADDSALEDTVYYSLDASTDIKEGLSLGGTIGRADFDTGTDYTHYQVSLSKGDFTFAFDDNDLSGKIGDPRVSVAWSHAIDL